jgi:hypothetical protein
MLARTAVCSRSASSAMSACTRPVRVMSCRVLMVPACLGGMGLQVLCVFGGVQGPKGVHDPVAGREQGFLERGGTKPPGRHAGGSKRRV